MTAIDGWRMAAFVWVWVAGYTTGAMDPSIGWVLLVAVATSLLFGWTWARGHET